MLIVDHEIDAAFCDLPLHALKALRVNVELALRAYNVPER